ncbi:MAG: MFS transporter [Ectothiorhodospiraceae bacterium]|nr:MFS transporter [Chromatiales bacterium]MCP5157080.1 MFS transporter [Ectothiorhodospiraceae bacterium]
MSSSPPGPEAAAAPPPTGRLALLRERPFLLLWLAGTSTSIVRWLEMLAIGVFVFDRTGSPFVVAGMTILRMVPLALFGVFSGAVAERFDRRRILLVGIAAMAVVSGVLAALEIAGRLALWHVGLGAFLSGVFWVTDLPARRSLMGEAAGASRVGAAMSLDTVTSNGTRVLGPLLGGLLLQVVGIDGAYLLGVVVYALSFALLVPLRTAPEHASAPTGALLASVVEGLRHVRSSRDLCGILAVTVVFNIWGFPCTSMVPVIAREELGLPPFEVGVLASLDGAGALVGALLVMLLAPTRLYRRIYFGGVALYTAMFLLFAHADGMIAAGAMLAVGLGGAAFGSMQATLVFLNSPANVRQRMLGVLSVCIGTGPIGFLALGLLASWVGAPLAVSLFAVQGLVALLVVRWIWPEVTAQQSVSP